MRNGSFSVFQFRDSVTIPPIQIFRFIKFRSFLYNRLSLKNRRSRRASAPTNDKPFVRVGCENKSNSISKVNNKNLRHTATYRDCSFAHMLESVNSFMYISLRCEALFRYYKIFCTFHMVKRGKKVMGQNGQNLLQHFGHRFY